MMFWILAAILTVAALFSVAYPLLRKPGRSSSTFDYDREIYKARLGEIDKDLGLGRIGEREAGAAKAEEGRKLLQASVVEEGRKHDGGTRVSRITLAAVLVAIPIVSVSAYIAAGRPGMEDMAIATRPDRDVASQSIDQLLDQAEARLAAEPNDLRGWAVVAPVYLRLGRVQEAIIAYRNALRLAPDDPEFRISLAEAIIVDAQGMVKEEARKLLVEALEKSPGNARARFYLAIAASQEGDLENASNQWQTLIADAPQDAPWLEAARAQYASVREKLGEQAPPESSDGDPSPGPTGEQIAAASQMSAADRQEMIRSMVTRLADRLEEDPSDIDGWRRLIRSYSVLGEGEKAREAIATARLKLASNVEFMEELATIERSLNGSGGGSQ